MAYNDWLTITPTSGKGNGIVNATVSSHSGYLERTKNVKISAIVDGVAKEKTVAFTQIGTDIHGFGTVIGGGSNFTRPIITPDELKAKRSWQFNIDGTNAKDFQYYVEVVSGNITREELTGILSEPTINSEFLDVENNTTVALTTLNVTTTTISGKPKTVYSMDGTHRNKYYGKRQTYSIRINTTPGEYKNTSYENDVTVKYGLAIVDSSDKISELTSFTVTYPAMSSFAVEGGGIIPSAGGTSTINIVTKTGVDWTAEIV